MVFAADLDADREVETVHRNVYDLSAKRYRLACDLYGDCPIYATACACMWGQS